MNQKSFNCINYARCYRVIIVINDDELSDNNNKWLVDIYDSILFYKILFSCSLLLILRAEIYIYIFIKCRNYLYKI